MSRSRLKWLCAAIFAIAASQAVAQTTAEKLYDQIANLPQQQRQKILEDGARKEGQLVFVHTLRAKLGRDHIGLFGQRSPFIKVDPSDMGSQEATERWIQEERAGRHLTDVMSLAIPDLDPILALDMTAKFPTKATDAILPKYRNFLDPQNRWTPYYWSDQGVIYNTNMVPPDKAPKSWEDLCKPEFHGQVSFDGPNIRYLVGIYTMMGEEKMKAWLQCIGKNKPIIQLGMAQRFELMLAGDHAVQGQNFIYYCPYRKLQTPAAPCDIMLSAPVLGFAGAMVINKNTTRPHAAALLAEWALTEESESYLAKGYRGPLTLKHPYLPDNVQVVTYNLTGQDVVDKVLQYWDQYITKVN